MNNIDLPCYVDDIIEYGEELFVVESIIINSSGIIITAKDKDLAINIKEFEVVCTNVSEKERSARRSMYAGEYA